MDMEWEYPLSKYAHSVFEFWVLFSNWAEFMWQLLHLFHVYSSFNIYFNLLIFFDALIAYLSHCIKDAPIVFLSILLVKNARY